MVHGSQHNTRRVAGQRGNCVTGPVAAVVAAALGQFLPLAVKSDAANAKAAVVRRGLGAISTRGKLDGRRGVGDGHPPDIVAAMS